MKRMGKKNVCVCVCVYKQTKIIWENELWISGQSEAENVNFISLEWK